VGDLREAGLGKAIARETLIACPAPIRTGWRTVCALRRITATERDAVTLRQADLLDVPEGGGLLRADSGSPRARRSGPAARRGPGDRRRHPPCAFRGGCGRRQRPPRRSTCSCRANRRSSPPSPRPCASPARAAPHHRSGWPGRTDAASRPAEGAAAPRRRQPRQGRRRWPRQNI